MSADRSSEAELRTLSRDGFPSAFEVLKAAVENQFDFGTICATERAKSSLVRATTEGALRVAFRRGEVVGAYAGAHLKGIALWHAPGTSKLPTFWEQWSCYPIPWRSYLSRRTLQSLTLIQRATRRACPRERDAWHLAGLAVLRDARGAGMGSRLVKAGQDRARQGGHPLTVISVEETLPFYEKLGFRPESCAAVRGLVEFHGLLWLPEGPALTPPASP